MYAPVFKSRGYLNFLIVHVCESRGHFNFLVE